MADWYSFQNIASIHTAFSDWFGIEFWKLLRRRRKIGKRIASAGYTAQKPFNATDSDIPPEWADQMAGEMHNARTNQDHQYLRTCLAAGRYNHIRV